VSLVEIESKKNVDKGVYTKTTEEKILNLKSDISKKETKLEIINKEVFLKLQKKQEELDEIS